ncbi:MAG: hypothetical protein HEP71_02080 [Roseivirga sp.]|nr:hypothetical protein [Roseivirga sp.]
MDKSKIIDHYTEEIASGRKDFGQVRADLKTLGHEDEYIDQVIRYIDNKLIAGDFQKVGKKLNREYFYVGIFLLAAGLISTLGTYFGIIDIGNVYVITYGPIAAGLGLIVKFRP